MGATQEDELWQATARATAVDIVMELSPFAATELRPETELVAELGYDSLGLLELVAALEDALGLASIDDRELAGMRCVADVQRIVAAAAKSPPASLEELA
jgi:acyl carrier protein